MDQAGRTERFACFPSFRVSALWANSSSTRLRVAGRRSARVPGQQSSAALGPSAAECIKPRSATFSPGIRAAAPKSHGAPQAKILLRDFKYVPGLGHHPAGPLYPAPVSEIRTSRPGGVPDQPPRSWWTWTANRSGSRSNGTAALVSQPTAIRLRTPKSVSPAKAEHDPAFFSRFILPGTRATRRSGTPPTAACPRTP